MAAGCVKEKILSSAWLQTHHELPSLFEKAVGDNHIPLLGTNLVKMQGDLPPPFSNLSGKDDMPDA